MRCCPFETIYCNSTVIRNKDIVRPIVGGPPHTKESKIDGDTERKRERKEGKRRRGGYRIKGEPSGFIIT